MADDVSKLEKQLGDVRGAIAERQTALRDSEDTEQRGKLRSELGDLRIRERRLNGALSRARAEADAKARQDAHDLRAALLMLERASGAIVATPLHVEIDELRAAAARVGGLKGPNSKLAKAAREMAEAIAGVHEAAAKLAEVKAAA